MNLTEVETALVARGAVRRGRHLRVSCPVPGHVDTRPSCDVDLERGWICRSCGRGGGLRELAELLGVRTPSVRAPRHRPRVSIPPPGIAWADWVPAWLEIVKVARRQQQRLAPHCWAFLVADFFVRPRLQAVAAAHKLVSQLGDTDEAWALVRRAAHVATEARALEWELDEVSRRV